MQKSLKSYSLLSCYVLIIFCILVLAGWKFEISILKHPLPGLVSMNPATAITFILAALGFIFLSAGDSGKNKKIPAFFLSGMVIFMGAAKILEILLNADFHLDDFIFYEKVHAEIIENTTNRMAPNTALNFVLIGISLWLLPSKSVTRQNTSMYLSLMVIALGLFATIGYLYGVKIFYGVLSYIPMSFYSSVCFMLLGSGILFASPPRGFMAEFTSQHSGGYLARILIPAAIVIPVILGLLRLYGERVGLFIPQFGTALFAFSTIIIFLYFIWVATKSINKKDSLRKLAEEELKNLNLELEQRVEKRTTDLKTSEEKILKMNQELEKKVEERTKMLNQKMQELKESEEKFHKAFQVSPAGITITCSSDSKFFEVNDSFVKMTGYSRDELLNRTSLEVGIIMDFKKREEILKDIMEKGYARNFEMTVRIKSGKVLEILGSVERIILNGISYSLSIIYDISDRKKAEEQLASLNKELEAFTYSVSHDLRAPLRAIDGYSNIIGEEYSKLLDSEGKRLLGIIQYNAKKMGTLIDDLLAFSRLGRKELLKTSIDTPELVEGALYEIQKSVNHTAKINILNLLPVKADYSLLSQVFVNLISNGIKYSSKQKNPSIEINSEKTDSEIIFSIKDNGVGFDMQYAHKLFGVFQRLHSPEDFEGTGVGLALVQRIINKHGGRVWAEGKPDKGATFYFALPA